MKLVLFALRSVNTRISHPFHRSNITRTLSTNPFSGNGNESNRTNDSIESADEFERRIFSGSSGNSLNSYAFFQKLDRLEKARNRPGGLGNGYGNERGSDSSVLDGLGESFDTLSDGMDGKLQKAAMYFEYDEDEVEQDGYAFRPDVSFRTGMTYEVKDLDLTKPGVRKPARRHEFEVTTEEVLRKADFRNVRFLANFITEAGIIIKRSKTGISAKAQRKVAREIKTARAFGLMPFTTMGTKSFIFGNTMQNCDEDYEYQTYDRGMPADFDGKGPSEV